MRPVVLYISYDGVLEPLGESQVVSYLERLADDSLITLLTFEKPEDAGDAARMAAMAARLAARGITWLPLRYHKRPPVLSTIVDVLRGIWCARAVARSQRTTILHARGYVPSLIALGARSVTGAAFLFDMRGFWVDEKVEAGHWPAGGWLFRVGKWWEKRFYARADAVVSLTEAGARAITQLGVTLRPGLPVEVIPTCADLQRFSPAPRDTALAAQLGLGDAPVVGCVGTMGNWYLRQQMIDCLALFSREWPVLTILIVTRDDHDALRADLVRAGVPAHRLVITRAGFEAMPRYIRLFDAGLFFIKPTFAKRASAATKMAEFLGCGVPVIINDGVGDSGDIVRRGRVGVSLATLDLSSYGDALAQARSCIADPETPARCRRVASDVFDLERGVDRYRRLYATMVRRP